MKNVCFFSRSLHFMIWKWTEMSEFSLQHFATENDFLKRAIPPNCSKLRLRSLHTLFCLLVFISINHSFVSHLLRDRSHFVSEPINKIHLIFIVKSQVFIATARNMWLTFSHSYGLIESKENRLCAAVCLCSVCRKVAVEMWNEWN